MRVQDEQAAEQTLREISARFVPGLELNVGAIKAREGDRVRVIWSTEGWLPDETFVALCVDVGGSALRLHMDTCWPLRPPTPPPPRAYTAAVVLSMIMAGGAAAWHFRAFWPTVGVLVGVVVAWVLADVVQQVRAERIARRRVLDEAAWRQHLMAALG
jgi:hypothetical protein